MYVHTGVGHHMALLTDVDNHVTVTHLSENAGLDLGAEVFERDRLGVRDAARRSIVVVVGGGVELLETGGRLAGVTQCDRRRARRPLLRATETSTGVLISDPMRVTYNTHDFGC